MGSNCKVGSLCARIDARVSSSHAKPPLLLKGCSIFSRFLHHQYAFGALDICPSFICPCLRAATMMQSCQGEAEYQYHEKFVNVSTSVVVRGNRPDLPHKTAAGGATLAHTLHCYSRAG